MTRGFPQSQEAQVFPSPRWLRAFFSPHSSGFPLRQLTRSFLFAGWLGGFPPCRWRRALPWPEASELPIAGGPGFPPCRPIEMSADSECSAAYVIGLQTHERQGEEGRNQSRQSRVLNLRRPVESRLSRVPGDEPGSRRRHTFSSSGRPSNPVGRRTSTRIRTTKTETSLYSTEK